MNEATAVPPARKRRKKKGWYESVGEYGSTVAVFEDPSSKIINGLRIIYGELRNPATGKLVSRSLGRIAREEAVAWAAGQAKALKENREVGALLNSRPTVGRILDLYLQHQTPRKSASEQRSDRTRVKAFKVFLTSAKDLSKLTQKEWRDFGDARLSGVIAPDGTLVPIDEREVVKPGTVAADLSWLRSVVRWACAWRDERGKVLMERDSTAGLELPVDQNISRPVATTDRYRKLREHSDKVMMEVVAGGKKLRVRTYLSELVDLAFHTGRRISAILAIQYDDLHLNLQPFGAITWRAETDKMGKAWTAPLHEAARAAIDRVLADRPRPDIGASHLFPSPRSPHQPVSKDLASAWLEQCERIAGVSHLKQGLWHPFRRAWATGRKHWPVQDVMAVGGWTDPSCLTTIYQQPDVDTMIRVATEAAEVREVSHG